jgi:hypothetical protein
MALGCTWARFPMMTSITKIQKQRDINHLSVKAFTKSKRSMLLAPTKEFSLTSMKPQAGTSAKSWLMHLKKSCLARHQWLTLVLATQEAEIRRILV